MTRAPSSFAEFWPHYLAAHRDPRTRACHYASTTLGAALLVGFAASGDWRLLAAAPVAGYAVAMASHPLFEGNRPATFTHPAWSLLADFYMLYLAATGRLGAELARLAPRP
jgi:hypothetical protein